MGCIQSAPKPNKKADHAPKAPDKPAALDSYVQAKYNKSDSCEPFYQLGKVLGRGGFATVRLGTHVSDGKKYAIKIMDVARPGTPVKGNDNTWTDVMAEIAVLCKLEHPNIISLKEFFIIGSQVYLVTNLVSGGELLDAVLKRGAYSEAVARQCFRQLLEGIAYCHDQGVVHRDIKLDNLLLERPGDITQIRIVDFGLAKGHQNKAIMQMKTVCGTPHYVAPEVVEGKGRYGPEVDLWSCGVCLFILLSGSPPFFHPKDAQLYERIKKGAYSFQDPIWDLISDEAKDLITKLLVVNPANRLPAREALQHPWLNDTAQDNPLTGTLVNLREFHMRDAVTAVVAANRIASAGAPGTAQPEQEQQV